jgi:hypothetical protein
MNPGRGGIYRLPLAHGVLFARTLYLGLKGTPSHCDRSKWCTLRRPTAAAPAAPCRVNQLSAIFPRAREARRGTCRTGRRILFRDLRLGANAGARAGWGPSERCCGRRCGGAGAVRAPRATSPPLSRSDISGWRDSSLYPLATPRAATTCTRSVSRATRWRRRLLVRELPDRGDDCP